jgi:hypothetical protein
MSEAIYSIDRDLSEAKALADHLIPYVYERELYGSIGGMFGSGAMPSLTLGGLLLRLHRLHALEAGMSESQRAQLAAIDAAHNHVRKEWLVHYNDKLTQEAQSRLKMIDQFFEECADDPRTCYSNYPPEAMRRTIVEVIANEQKRDGTATSEIERAMGRIDSQLRRFTTSGSFIWASALQPVYPKDEYWWLYAQPPRASAG